MANKITIEVDDVKDTIKQLRLIDPELRKQFNRDARSIAQPVMQEAKSRYTTLPLSGFRRKWTDKRGRELAPKTIGRFRFGVTFKVDTTRKRRSVFVVKQQNRLASAFDMAGRATPGNRLDASLDIAGFGQPSRVMWPAAEARIDEVQDALVTLVRETERMVDRKLKR